MRATAHSFLVDLTQRPGARRGFSEQEELRPRREKGPFPALTGSQPRAGWAGFRLSRPSAPVFPPHHRGAPSMFCLENFLPLCKGRREPAASYPRQRGVGTVPPPRGEAWHEPPRTVPLPFSRIFSSASSSDRGPQHPVPPSGACPEVPPGEQRLRSVGVARGACGWCWARGAPDGRRLGPRGCHRPKHFLCPWFPQVAVGRGGRGGNL